MRSLAVHAVAENKQTVSQMYVFYDNIAVFEIDVIVREIPERLYPEPDQRFAKLRRGGFRNAKDRDPRALCLTEFGKTVYVHDPIIPDLRPDQRLVGIEDPAEHTAVFFKA